MNSIKINKVEMARWAKAALRKILPKFMRKAIWFIHTKIWIFRNREKMRISAWLKHTGDPRLPEELKVMIGDYIRYNNKDASKYWIMLGERHIIQLLNGYDNFKQTVAFKYFTWKPLKGSTVKILQDRGRDWGNRNHDQLQFLIDNNDEDTVKAAQKKAEESRLPACFTSDQAVMYNFATFLFWEYLLKIGLGRYLSNLSEPAEGNPISVQIDGRDISQDLLNSVIEFSSVTEYSNFSEIKIIAELGAGYGRDAFVFLKLRPHLRYVVIDIPPALYLSQRYLSSQFPDRKIFRYRHFNSFFDVEKEFNESSLIFLMPWQMEMLPPKIIDGFMAIDSLHEMRSVEVRRYFSAIDRITGKFFYFKCWKDIYSSMDQTHLKEDNYPVLSRWHKVYSRECRVQTKYFEALYDLED